MITALVPVRNVEHIIGRCLEQLRWVDEVLLADGFSTDGTHAIAAQFPNVRIIQHPSPDIRVVVTDAEKEASHPWILWLCADEVVTPGLADEIQRRCREAGSDVSGFILPSRDVLFGADYGKGGAWGRLWRKGTARFAFERIHEMPIITGRLETLTQPYLHINNPNIRTVVPKYLRYEYIDAQKATDEACSQVNPSFWYQLIRFNFYAIREYWPKRRLGFPAVARAQTAAFGQLLRHLLLVEELRIRRGLTIRDTHGW
jgi:glycosyltransferase involved in cell wall biosynthesis